MADNTYLRVRFCTHCSSFLIALLCSRIAVDADCLSSDGVLQKDVSESGLVGMDDRLEEEGNWLLMFPVSSLIWKESWIIFLFSRLFYLSVQLLSIKFIHVSSEYYVSKCYADTATVVGLVGLLLSQCKANCQHKTILLLYHLCWLTMLWKDYKQVKGQEGNMIYYIMDTMATMMHDVNISTDDQ